VKTSLANHLGPPVTTFGWNDTDKVVNIETRQSTRLSLHQIDAMGYKSPWIISHIDQIELCIRL
jgi:hypothetical protein